MRLAQASWPLSPHNFPNFQLVIIDVLKILHYYELIFRELVITMPTNASESLILTIKQVADYLKVTERTIYRLAAAKKIPAFKVGGTWRFSRADIDSWIRQQSMEGFDMSREDNDVAKDQSNDGIKK